MSPPAETSARSHDLAPTATYKVRFGRAKGNGSGNGEVRASRRIPRVTRILALAYCIEGMIRSGELRDWADAARLIGVTRARMTQIANLLLLAPGIQEAIIMSPQVVRGQNNIVERNLRLITSTIDWNKQKRKWEDLLYSV